MRWSFFFSFSFFWNIQNQSAAGNVIELNKNITLTVFCNKRKHRFFADLTYMLNLIRNHVFGSLRTFSPSPFQIFSHLSKFVTSLKKLTFYDLFNSPEYVLTVAHRPLENATDIGMFTYSLIILCQIEKFLKWRT